MTPKELQELASCPSLTCRLDQAPGELETLVSQLPRDLAITIVLHCRREFFIERALGPKVKLWRPMH